MCIVQPRKGCINVLLNFPLVSPTAIQMKALRALKNKSKLFWGKLNNEILNQTSQIQNQTSQIKHQTSDISQQTSAIPNQTSYIRYPKLPRPPHFPFFPAYDIAKVYIEGKKSILRCACASSCSFAVFSTWVKF